MPVINFDASDSDPNAAVSGGGEPAPVGTHHCQVASCESEAPEDKNPRIHAIYKIVDLDGYSNLHDYIVLAKSSEWKLDQLLQALGLASASKRTGQLDPAKQKGKDVKVLVRNETYDPGDGTGARNTAKVGGVYKWDGKLPANGAKAAVSEEPEIDPDTERWIEIMGLSEDDLQDIDVTAELEELGAEYGLEDGDALDTWTEWAAAIDTAMQGIDPNSEELNTEDEPEVDDEWTQLLGMAEEDLAENEDTLRALGEELGVDADTYETWAELIEAVNDAMNEVEPEADNGGIDYTSWDLKDINNELSERGLAASGSRAQKVARLEENDAEAAPLDS